MVLLALDPVVLVWAGVLAAGGAVALFKWWRSPYQRTLRALRAAPRVRIADAPEGRLVRIAGRLRAHGPTLTAPLSKRACAHYEIVVEDHAKRGESTDARVIFRESETRDFSLEDGSGTAIVETGRLEVALVQDHHQRSGTFEDASADLEALLRRHGQSSTGFFGLNRTIRYREGVLEPGEEVSVLGWARWEDDPEAGLDPSRGGYRESARRKRLVIHAGDGPVRASDDPATFS